MDLASLYKPMLDRLSHLGKRSPPSDPSPPGKPPLVDLGPVIKAPLDTKSYKVVQLRNGLKATLVSTCLHETKISSNQYLHSNGPSSSNDGLSSSPLQHEIDTFNRTYLGFSAYNQSDDSVCPKSTETNDNDKSSNWNLSNLTWPWNTSPAKMPKLVKCCKGPASICVTIGAGSFHDPQNVNGMAHFVEHLIFLGSKQHPEHNKLFRKVFENGGFVNATTYTEHTNFYFSCGISGFQECVEILVDSLTNPLFREADLRREIEAVDSEYGMKQTCDITRINDFLRSRAKAGHPFRTFYWGNKKSLNHPHIRSLALAWKQRYYRANYMTVCIQAPMPMEKLEEFVLEHFSDIPSSSPDAMSPSQELDIHGSPYSPEDFQTAYFVAPLSYLTCLAICWTLPSEFWRNYETKPLEYVKLMLHNTSPGGLRYYLRQKGWMTEWNNLHVNCCATDNYCRTAYCSFFNISIYLTDKGLEEKSEVIKAVFSYLKLLSTSGVNKRCFEEMKRSAATKFHFHNWDEMTQSGVNVAVNMQHVPAEHIITSTTLITKWNPDTIRQCVDMLTPRTANFTVVACENTKHCTESTLPCKIRYTQRNIGESYYKELEEIKVFPEFRVPSEGAFLVKEISLMSGGDISSKGGGKIHLSEKLLVQHANVKKSPCLSPRLPSAYYAVYISSHMVTGHSSRIKEGILYFWVRLLTDKIIQRVGSQFDHLFRYYVGINDDGISIHLEGPRCHLVELLTIVVRQIYDCDQPSANEASIEENLKVDLIRQYINDTYDVELLAEDMLSYLLQTTHATLFEIRQELEDLTFNDDDFMRIIKKFRKRTFIIVELQGSVTNGDAERIVDLFTGDSEENIQYSKPAILPQITDRATVLPVGTSRLCIKALHPAYVVSVVRNFYQVEMWKGDNARDFVLTLGILMRRRFTNQLRTAEQLGYAVRLMPVYEGSSLGISVTVITQPEKYTTDYVDSRIDAFFHTFYHKYLKTNEMRNYVKKTYYFDNALLNELDRFYRENLLKNGVNFRKLSIQVEGYKPRTKISTKKHEQLTGTSSSTSGMEDDEDADSMIRLRYMVVDDEKEMKRLESQSVYIITDVGHYKREMRLLPINNG